MIDARRWVIVEAWVSLGLRVEWISSWEIAGIPRNAWQTDNDGHARYLYDGFGVWKVERREGRRGDIDARTTVPELSLDLMTHELAHYLVASEEERGQRNFGIPAEAQTSDQEDRAQSAEKVIHALMLACGRIAGLALHGSRPRL